MNEADDVRIRPIAEVDAEGFRQAVGNVGRERVYMNSPAFCRHLRG